MQINYQKFIFTKTQQVKINVFLFNYIEPGEKTTLKDTTYCKTAYTATSVIDGNLFMFKVRLTINTISNVVHVILKSVLLVCNRLFL